MAATIDRFHLLVITEDDGEKDWRIVHPPTCSWNAYRYASSDPLDQRGGEEHWHFYRVCLTQWEIDDNGIDSLGVHTVDGNEHIDPDHVPSSQWESEWHRLRPGRYLVQATYSSSESWYDDSDSEFYIEAVSDLAVPA